MRLVFDLIKRVPNASKVMDTNSLPYLAPSLQQPCSHRLTLKFLILRNLPIN